jgi:hypothetical protein
MSGTPTGLPEAPAETAVWAGRRARADALASELRQMMADAAETVPPPLPPLPQPTVEWISRLTGAPVRTPAYEEVLARRTLADPFGFLALPPAPPFLDGISLDGLPPEHAAPLLTRLSMTRAAPVAADLCPATLAASSGPVTRVSRGTAARTWDQDPSANAPLLPEQIAIPHLIHTVWVGGPVPDGSPLRALLSDLAGRYGANAAIVVWTDVTRDELLAADAAPPAPASSPDPHAGARSMLAWARTWGISLVNIHEVFHADHPMTLHAPYVAEMAKQLPRGYAGASDHLRLDIIHAFGGLYTDGDNHPNPHSTRDTLNNTLHHVAASAHGFTLHVLATGINNDVIIAPARHPAIALWRELTRASYSFRQQRLFGGVKNMARSFIGAPREQWWTRYTVPWRCGLLQGHLFAALKIALDDPPAVRVGALITHDSQLSWASDKTTASPAVPTPAHTRAVTARALTTLARQLTSREGNLHLTAVAPAITTLPDPDTAWTAILTLLAELITAGALPPVTSLTQFRWTDHATPSHVYLPPEAETLINRKPPPAPWLGHQTTKPGHPAWLLDEAVTPATLHPRVPPTAPPEARPTSAGTAPVAAPVAASEATSVAAPEAAPVAAPEAAPVAALEAASVAASVADEGLRGRIAAARAGRRARAGTLAGELRQMMTDAAGTVPPALPPLPGPTVEWIRRVGKVPVRAAAFEVALARRILVDLFGFLALPSAPAFLAGVSLDGLPPEHAAPLLTRLSMTRAAPTGADLTPAALAAAPGPVTRAWRTPAGRRWGQLPSANAPLLPEQVAIPHLVHTTWVGGPVPDGSPLRALLSDLAGRYGANAALIVWTDVTRDELLAADAATPAPPGVPDPHAGPRSMLHWARTWGISLVNIHEVFHADHPITLHAPYVAEMAKQLPRGYAGASDHLRLDIIHTFGGLYTDGDNHPNPHSTAHTLTATLQHVAGSLHGFTLHIHDAVTDTGVGAGIDSDAGADVGADADADAEGKAVGGGSETGDSFGFDDHIVNNDVIVAPPRHPAIALWRELDRASYVLPQQQLFGGIEGMAQHFAERPTEKRWTRYTVPRRAGLLHCHLLEVIGAALNDYRLVRVGALITHDSQLSWASDKTTASPAVPTPAHTRAVTARALTTLARQLTSREGNLHLTAVAPAITTLPDPDTAWTAILTLLAELTASGAVPAVTSITEYRLTDDAAPSHVRLPREAEHLIDRNPPPGPWLGHQTTKPGHPAWLLDETVTPAALRPQPQAAPPLTTHLTHVDGTPVLHVGGRPDPAAPPPPTIGGHATIAVNASYGQAWATPHHPLNPEDLALHLHHHNLHNHPLLITAQTPNPHTLQPLARQLQHHHPHPIHTTETPPAAGDERPADERLLDHVPAGASRRVSRAARTVADALVAARDLDRLRAVGRHASGQAGRRMAGRDGLVSALDTRWIAGVLADADAMARVSGGPRDAARRAAADRVRGAYRVLSDGLPGAVPGVLPGALPGAEVIEDAVLAAGAVAGVDRVSAALRSRERGADAARRRAELNRDEQAQREIRAARRRLSLARRAGASGGRSSAAAEQEEAAAADRLLAEVEAGRWPALAARLKLVEWATREARAAAAVRAVAAARTAAATERARRRADRPRSGQTGQAWPVSADVVVTDTRASMADSTADSGADEGRPGRIAAVRAGRRARADALAAELRKMMADTAGTVPPPLPPLPLPTVDWIRKLTGAPVRTPAYEEVLARRTLADPFGFLALPAAAPFLDGLSLGDLPPEHAAPLLTRLSMTRPAPRAGDLTALALAAAPGPVTRARRDAGARGWEQNPAAGAPLLPEQVVIPHVIHTIWVGGPVPEGAPLRVLLTDLATRYGADAALILWTDVTRDQFLAADAAAPAPPGAPDPHADARSMLAWARSCGISLVNIHEVFHAANPMTLHAPYTAEMAKQLPRGYAGASDHLRLDIIHTFGGLYTDGDNHPNPHSTTGTLTTTLHHVATAPHAFTVHALPNGINNDLIIAPPRHPAITLWRELGRINYWHTQPELFREQPMIKRWATWPVMGLLRHSVVLRSGRVHHRMLRLAGIAHGDERLVRVGALITHDSQLSWASEGTTAPPVPPTPAQVRTAAARAVTTLARQLTSRDGNLHLTAVAPAITTLPDPDTAWTAILTVLAELTASGTIPAVTSITEFRWTDSATPSHVLLPAEAEHLINRSPRPGPWLGHQTTKPGHPAWLLDETVTPATLNPAPEPPPELVTYLTDHNGTPVLHLGGPPDPGTPPPPTIGGHATITVNASYGQAWATPHHPLNPEDLALHLHHHNLHNHPLLITAQTPNPHTLQPLARQLQHHHPHPIHTTN